jgi:hypothetical protein
VNVSRVTWLALGTTMVLVSSVLVAAILFIDGGSEPFPRGTGPGGSGVAHLGTARVGTANRGEGAGAARLTVSPGRGQVAAQPAVVGLAASLGAPGGPQGPSGPGGPGGPPGNQYGNSLEQLNAKLWGD